MKKILLLSLLFLGCTDYSAAPEAAVGNKDLPNQEGWDSKAYFTDRGLLQAELHFAHMRRWDNKQLTTFSEGLRVEFYEEGQHNATLTSDSGEIHGGGNNLTAIGSVVIRSDSGLSMFTEKIFWDDANQKIIADGFVTMASGEDTLNGYEFESNKDLTNWKMKNAFGQSSRDIDLRTGTVRPRATKKESDLDRETQKVLDEQK